MLQKMREHIQGWVAGIIIALVAIAFVMWGLQYYLERSNDASQVVAKVNGTKITEKELGQAWRRLLQEQRANGNASLSDNEKQQLKQLALQQLIQRTALLKASREAGFRVSLEQAQQLIVNIPAFQVGGRFSKEKFQQILMANSLSPATFFSHLQATLVNEQVSAGVQGTAFVLPNELKQAYLLLKEQRDAGYFILPTAKFQKGVTVSQQEVANFYAQNKSHYKTPEQVSVAYIVLSPEAIRKSVSVSEQQAKQYYDSHQSNYTIPQRWQVLRVIAKLPKDATQAQVQLAQKTIQQYAIELEKGISLEKLKKVVGKNVVVASQWINQDQVTDSLQQVLTALKQGQVSQPFRTQQGLNVVKLRAYEKSRLRPFNAVKLNIQQMLVQQKTEQVLSKKGEQLSNLTYTNPTTLEPAAKALGVVVQKTPLMSRQGTKSGIFADPHVLKVVFSDDVLKQENNSNPIELKNGDVVVVRVDKFVPSKPRPLAEVQADIKQRLLKGKENRKAGLVAYAIQTALAKGTSPSAVAKKYGISWRVQRRVNRINKTIPKEIVSAIFSLTPVKADKNAAVTSVELKNGNYAIIQLLGITHPSFKQATPKEKKMLDFSLLSLDGQVAYKFYTKSVLDHTKIKIIGEKS